MARLEWLQQEECENRRSIADAVNVLPEHAIFDRVRTVEISVGRLRLSSNQIVGLVGIFVENAAAQTISLVALPSAKQFRARPEGSQELETFDIFRLDRATVDGRGTVELVDGTLLRAVEVVPALLPYNVTDLDWRILHHIIAMMKAEQECYTYPIRFAQPSDALDCSKLPALRGKVPPRKEILRYIAKQDPALKVPSRQKIDDTLHKFLML
ncbi:hypothetical protein [Bradyrhizobium sp. SHOUNA76]|uniref:hypothetical protein n=1 Tax=Bradyrhizobium sp. SHOUNA76 TaxID=2908927 RepID=UPI001FF47C9D|nr:hypothetical protein [Bradyrhizobium sp. SHOUNA76]MCJ9700816.1 hypothetical protein [Bradyrhizobium sp. SHOUNA76]